MSTTGAEGRTRGDAGNDQYDVAVIGYGPTGVTAANLLGGMGLRVLVLERDAEIFTRARAISTDEEVMRIWQRIGLAERLKRDMLTERPVDFVDANGRPFVSARPTPRGHGHPPQMFIYQPALEQVLRDGVDRYPNVRVLLRHECLRLRQDAEGVELTVVGTADDSVHRLHASYVIAADGGSSLTRAQLNIGYEGKTYEDRWVVIDTKMLKPWPDHDKLRFHCDPARPAVDCPTPLDHHRWEFPILPGDDEKQLTTEDAVHRLVARYGISRDSIKVLRATVYSHHVRFATRFRMGRVFLAGDAAHAMPPWIGQGMAAGVRDVANLCWKLDAVLHGELPESVLDSYEAERKPHVKEVTKRAVFVGRIITERRLPVARVRDGVLRALDRVPGFADRMQDANWIPVARYDTGLQARPRAKAHGSQVPQPWVTGPDGTRVRLDDALGGRWLLLHSGMPTPQPAWERLALPSLAITPVGSSPGEGTLVDSDGVLLPWMREHRASTLALRPDAYVYAAAPAGAPLPPPPAGFAPAAVFRSAGTGVPTETTAQ
ncbi:bifunctional 3-(3-hydroxy-phenyl)propionate/3-hydroxycinnamic acid hydroxylase [Streptomyces althioticus]|uniref:Bifunctional 3-(3-hydroxy-phenyl)propionate/3-hydroxycinnamic acid hydroxylase n=1 Tax=Streptomyces althioticus TaxID=83380 RepID=A0ABZ1XZT4_9ACTN|nr:bifunctional 3-(3-hydroxy-phenyl)propionate/3-hydroxycinnamic acid hydroxylase [Streptomyces sp. H28]MBD9730945.1 bifunctional 3-(3-hydroxy-phenyl)propionate/3-hydroxycinnamic acid hydroxylase [Streptomyces sp. H28]